MGNHIMLRLPTSRSWQGKLTRQLAISAFRAKTRWEASVLLRALGHGRRPAGLFAGALGDVFPLGRIHVLLGLSSAGMGAHDAGAIILAGLGDTEALFFWRIGRMGKTNAGHADGSEGGSEQSVTFVHGISFDDG